MKNLMNATGKDNSINNPIAVTIVRGLIFIAIVVVIGAIVGPWLGKPAPSEGVLDIAQQIVAAAVGMLAKTTLDKVNDLRDILTGSDDDAAPVPVTLQNTAEEPGQVEVVAPPELAEAAEESVRPPDEELPDFPDADEGQPQP